MQLAGIDFDVDTLESDPAIILQQADASRELRAYAAINDAVRAGLIAFATDSDLDHLGLTAPKMIETEGGFEEGEKRGGGHWEWR